MELTHKDYRMLQIMYLKGYVNKICGASLEKITEDNIDEERGISYSFYTIRASIKTFEMLGIVAKGIKSGRKNTYFLTEKGINIAKEVMENLKEATKIRGKGGNERC